MSLLGKRPDKSGGSQAEVETDIKKKWKKNLKVYSIVIIKILI